MHLRTKHRLRLIASSIILVALLLSLFIPRPMPNTPTARMKQEPIQLPTGATQFIAQTQRTNYYVKPLYQYELNGLVVSMSKPREHYMADIDNDFKAVDLCVVFGDNLINNLYRSLTFRNGDFTCFISTDDYSIWRQFNMEHISNNHLITNDPAMVKRLRNIKIGDQVTIKGYLAEYGFENGRLIRGSSTVRNDTGNGACETIFVQHLHVEKAPTDYRLGLRIGLILLLIVLFIL
ncbi:hypothetical protein VQ643_13930 [Pseudomonas sp. F1_0610]|uniref:hypothetical protein n=1 Tax=Pseudomonas sp. F1_0610 TaxID=3114284 RepID=UPI0039C45AF4